MNQIEEIRVNRRQTYFNGPVADERRR